MQKVKNMEKLLKRATNFSFTGINGKWDEVDGRILLGDNSGAGAVFLRPIMFHFAGVLTSTGVPFLLVRVELTVFIL
jgi:hypothetical protein